MDLGLERAGMECAYQVEIDDYAQKVLAKHWPNVPRFRDVRDVGAHNLPLVDLICGGFPCTEISSANVTSRVGLQGKHSGLWSEYARIVFECRPTWVVIENSPEWRSWVPYVRAELAQYGYASVPLVLRAFSFGAPHHRPRCFIVANANSQGESLRAIYEAVAGICAPTGALWNGWTSPPGGFRLDDGIPDGMDRCRVAGNAVIPRIAEWIGRQIMSNR